MKLFLGPPGTGKTHKLISIVEDALDSGVDPSKIGFFSFTRKAANEARDRACAKFKLKPSQLPWFRTLHSFAFRILGLHKAGVFTGDKQKEFAEYYGLELGADLSPEDGFVKARTPHDKMLGLDQLARNKMITLQEAFNELDEDMNWWTLAYVVDCLNDFKSANNLMDFTDMLEDAADQMDLVPALDVLILDEAQDMTRLQWTLFLQMRLKAKTIYLAGDDDQAIFDWAGADTAFFKTIGCDTEVLGQSYRVPRTVQRFANTLMDSVKRYPKLWKSRDAEGSVHFHNNLDELDLSKGSWYLLARTNYQLQRYVDFCQEHGYYYSINDQLSISKSIMQAVNGCNEILSGKIVDDETHKKVDYYRAKPMPRPPWTWFNSLTKIPEAKRLYIKELLARGETIDGNPRIKISTIHGVKGGEADHVVLITDVGTKVYDKLMKDPDPEHRVFYVGATRARETLHIMEPTTNCYITF